MLRRRYLLKVGINASFFTYIFHVLGEKNMIFVLTYGGVLKSIFLSIMGFNFCKKVIMLRRRYLLIVGSTPILRGWYGRFDEGYGRPF